MENPTLLMITRGDYQKLSALAARTDTNLSELLGEELSRASIVPSTELPPDVVTMNSKITFTDMDSGKESQITLVYPQDANIEENKISVLAPVGMALIGLRVGQTIQWPMPHGAVKKLRVTAVLYQPEAAGDETS